MPSSSEPNVNPAQAKVHALLEILAGDRVAKDETIERLRDIQATSEAHLQADSDYLMSRFKVRSKNAPLPAKDVVQSVDTVKQWMQRLPEMHAQIFDFLIKVSEGRLPATPEYLNLLTEQFQKYKEQRPPERSAAHVALEHKSGSLGAIREKIALISYAQTEKIFGGYGKEELPVNAAATRDFYRGLEEVVAAVKAERSRLAAATKAQREADWSTGQYADSTSVASADTLPPEKTVTTDHSDYHVPKRFRTASYNVGGQYRAGLKAKEEAPCVFEEMDALVAATNANLPWEKTLADHLLSDGVMGVAVRAQYPAGRHKLEARDDAATQAAKDAYSFTRALAQGRSRLLSAMQHKALPAAAKEKPFAELLGRQAQWEKSFLALKPENLRSAHAVMQVVNAHPLLGVYGFAPPASLQP